MKNKINKKEILNALEKITNPVIDLKAKPKQAEELVKYLESKYNVISIVDMSHCDRLYPNRMYNYQIIANKKIKEGK